jgi:hypothetical protein
LVEFNKNLFAQSTTTMADDTGALESATIESVTGSIFHDVVDYIQEKILKDRRSRSEEHLEILMVGCVLEIVQSIPHFDYFCFPSRDRLFV